MSRPDTIPLIAGNDICEDVTPTQFIKTELKMKSERMKKWLKDYWLSFAID